MSATLKRFEDWPSRLDSYFSDCLDKPFQYGDFDCAKFAAEGIEVMTGTDLFFPFRGHYHDRESAFAALKQFGADTLDALPSLCGLPRLSTIRQAGRGDLVSFDTDEGPALGLVTLSGRHFHLASTRGLVTLPLRAATASWKV